MYKKIFKRLIDIILATFGLLLNSPIILLVCILLYFANKGKGVFFLQSRPGKNEKIFRMIKFKTMIDSTENNGNILTDAQRLTKIGKIIRQSSFDEIPQLINVLKGEMSIIGPRPWLVKYLPLYTLNQKRRHEVRPGITGWAQVNGRNALDWEKRINCDIYYIDNLSFKLDVRIFYLTIKNILSRDGIYSDENLSINEFKGKNE